VPKDAALLSPAEVAHRFGVSPAAVSRWAKDGKIPFQRTLGGQRRFRIEDVERLLEGPERVA